MVRNHRSGIWRSLRQGATLAGIVVLTVATTLLTQRLISPSPVRAQATPGVVQATEFDLVGQNGTILAQLKPGGSSGGSLWLNDATGMNRVRLVGGGLLVFDKDGTTARFRAGYNPDLGPQGQPPYNGVSLDTNGTIDYLPAAPSP
jgi:hypothetical protein